MMQTAIEGRELITLSGQGVDLRGTYHKPDSTTVEQRTARGSNVGVLILNSLSAPRASNGNKAVYWATALASSGYPCFRVDLPGLGDSYAEIPNDIIHLINEGGYGAIASFAANDLVRRYDLDGIVILGHCAGATTAIFAAAECESCKGLVLLDPYFNLPRASTLELRSKLLDWARKTRLVPWFRYIYDCVTDIPELLRRRNAPPLNSNMKLLACWKQIACNGLPITIVKAPGPAAIGTKKSSDSFDYLKYVLTLAGRKGHVAITMIENADHSFTTRVAKKAVAQHIESWLSQLQSHIPIGVAAVAPAKGRDFAAWKLSQYS